MAQIFMDEGCVQAWTAYFNNSWPGGGKDLTLKLYTNDHTPVDTDTTAAYTEAAGGGYAAKTLSNGSWTVQTTAGIVETVYAQQTFTFTGPLNGGASLYGYYVVDAAGKLITAEKFGAAFTPFNNGDQYKITPKIQLSKGTPT